MKRRILIPFGIAGILILAVPLYVLMRPVVTSDPPITRARFDGINAGSSLAEIETLLGRPGNRASNAVIVWAPQDGTLISAQISGTPHVRFFPDAHADAGYELVWMDESGLIAGHFGKDDRLQEKYFSTVFNPGGPSFFKWIATRF